MINSLSYQILLENKVDKVPLIQKLFNTVGEVYNNTKINEVDKLDYFNAIIIYLGNTIQKLKDLKLIQKLIDIFGEVYLKIQLTDLKNIDNFNIMIKTLSNQIITLGNEEGKVPLMQELLNIVKQVYLNTTINNVEDKLNYFNQIINNLLDQDKEEIQILQITTEQKNTLKNKINIDLLEYIDISTQEQLKTYIDKIIQQMIELFVKLEEVNKNIVNLNNKDDIIPTN
jgi:hypothetical protein